MGCAPAVADAGAADAAARALGRLGLEVVTLNGFPYEAFHAHVVKHAVYRPDWAEPGRLDYTLGLARLLASLLPEDVDGGSDLDAAAGWRTEWDAAAADAGRRALEGVAAALIALEAETGKPIRLALEPEPGCSSGPSPRRRTSSPGSRRSGSASASTPATSRSQFEDPTARSRCGRRGRAHRQGAGVQRAAGARARDARAFSAGSPSRASCTRSARCVGGRVVGVDDLPDALGGGLPARHEWRVHFHVPVHAGRAHDPARAGGDARRAGRRAGAAHHPPRGGDLHVDRPARRARRRRRAGGGARRRAGVDPRSLVELGEEEIHDPRPARRRRTDAERARAHAAHALRRGGRAARPGAARGHLHRPVDPAHRARRRATTGSSATAGTSATSARSSCGASTTGWCRGRRSGRRPAARGPTSAPPTSAGGTRWARRPTSP